MAKVNTERFGTLAVLPVQATVPVNETLEWKTDLIVSFNGSETGQRLRAHPRHTLRYTLPEGIGRTQAQFISQYGALRERWCIPVWTESQFIGEIASASLEIECSPSLYDFRNNSLGFLYQQDGTWQVIEVEEVLLDRIIVSKPTASFKAAWIMPARVGYVVNRFDRLSKGHSAVTDVTFEVEDLQSIPELEPSTFYKNIDLYTDPTLFGGEGIASQIQTRTDRVDYEIGLIARRHPWLYNRVSRPRNIVCTSPEEVREFKGWLSRRCGRFRYYWEPSFENDLLIAESGQLTGTLVVRNDGIVDWPLRRNIAIQLYSGQWLTREILSVLVLGGNMIRLTVNTPLNINASDIHRISFLGCKRLDTDKIEMNWIGNGVLESTINSVEVKP